MIEEKKKLAVYHECLQCGNEFSCEIGFSCPHDSAELVPVYSDELEGTTLNSKYTIISLCGSGATGNVYRARHIALKRDVAVKFLHRHLIDDAQKLQRFEDEARALSDLTHPNVVKVIDYGSEPQPFITMEFASGKSLNNVLQTVGPFPYKIAIKVFLQIAEAMAFVHEKGFVHRDLKPSNIMVSKLETPCPEVKILDFGTAKLLDTKADNENEIIGSPPYMSPEQCSGDPVDARSDVYSLGCLMYEILTGEKPFPASTPEEYVYKHLNQLPQPPSRARRDLNFPEELDRLVCRALAKQVDFRLQSMNELIRELKAISTTRTTVAEVADIEDEKQQKLPLVLPGLASICCAFGLYTWFSWVREHNAMGLFFGLSNIAFTVAFSYAYWIYSIEKLLKIVSAESSKWSLKRLLLLATVTSPAAPGIAYVLFLVQLLLPDFSIIGWLLYAGWMLLITVGQYKIFARIAAGCVAATDKDKSIKEAFLSLALTTFGVLPIAAVPMLSKSPPFACGIALTCGIISYTILYFVRLELDKSKQPWAKTIIPTVLALLVLLCCDFELVENSPTVTLLTQRIERQPLNADLLFSRARLHTLKDDYELALADYNKGLELAPKNGAAWRDRGYLLQEKMHSYLEEAARSYENAAKLIPKVDSPSYSGLGCTYDRMGMPQKAMDSFQTALTSPGRSKNSTVINLANRAGTACRMGHYQLSVDEANRALAVGMDDRALYWRIRAYSLLGKVDLAKADLATLEKLYPDDRDLIILARSHFALARGDWQACLDAAGDVPKSREMLRIRAQAWLALGLLAKAKQEATAGLDTELNDTDRSDIGRSYFLMAKILYAQKEYSQAYKCCTYAYKMLPQKDIAEFNEKIKSSLPGTPPAANKV